MEKGEGEGKEGRWSIEKHMSRLKVVASRNVLEERCLFS